MSQLGPVAGTDPDAIGTNSIRHTWVAWTGAASVAFVFIWSILGISGKLNVITHTWDNLLISSSMVFIGAVLCYVNYRQTENTGPTSGSVADTTYRSAYINDLEFYKAMVITGIAFLCFALATYIEFFDVDGNSLYTKGWYISNVTDTAEHRVYTTRGTMKLVAGKLTMFVGFLVSLLCFFKFFLTDQGGVISSVWAKNNGSAPAHSFASTPAKNQATSSLINQHRATSTTS